VQLCIPFDVPVTLQITAASYPTTYMVEIDVTSQGDGGELALLDRGLQLIPTEELTAFSAFLQGSGGVNQSDAMVAAAVISISQQPPCEPTSGWSVGVEFVDGGTLPDGGPLPFKRAYLGSTDLPSATATETSSTGYAIMFNIDPTIANVAQLVATDLDGGSPCPSMNAQEMVTGRVTLAPGSVTFAPYFVP
jgi:hypothetical protein